MTKKLIFYFWKWMILFILFFLFQSILFAQDKIRLNQLGYYCGAPKIAVVLSPQANVFFVVDDASHDTIYHANLLKTEFWEYSGDSARKANFSKVNREGKFHLFVPGIGTSYAFEITHNTFLPAAKSSLKMYYLQRASIDIQEQYAGKFARKKGHPDDHVMVHPSAESASRGAGTIFKSEGGWYDAGDYNKYIVNSGISTYTLIMTYEHLAPYFDTLNTNIPESKNKIPDILDEVLYNLRWMLSMQDTDGGVYHKLTNSNFDGNLMPADAQEPRYVVMKTTAASLDFAAVCAVAHRIFKKYNQQMPGFSDSCLQASLNAWSWAKKNPNVKYLQNKMNAEFNPDIVTGAYDDNNLQDEFQWAATELFIATSKYSYLVEMNLEASLSKNFNIPNWQNVGSLGYYSLMTKREELEFIEAEKIELIKAKILKCADELVKGYKKSAFAVPIGTWSGDFCWGSNAHAGNEGIVLLQAYLISGDVEYMEAALAVMDYFLGRNGTSYSFLTGFGDKQVMHSHHRPSEADGITEPLPGYLVGGPNPGMEDASNCGGKYVCKLPASAYIDDVCSYASNEVAINWNAPFVYLSFSIHQHYKNSK